MVGDTPLEDRRFTDEEVREILDRAVRRLPAGAPVRGEGLTLAELQDIGKEVGIEPARLEDAARAVTLARGNRPNGLLGGPTVLRFERTAKGRLAPEDTPEVLNVIRSTMGLQGEVDESHGSLEWSAKGESGERSVTVSSRDGRTTIRGFANLSGTAALTYVPAGALGLIVSVASLLRYAKHGNAVALIVSVAVLIVLYPLLRTVYGKLSGSESARLERVVDELARLTEGSES